MPLFDRVLDQQPADHGRGGGQRREHRDQRHLALPLGRVGEEARRARCGGAPTRQADSSPKRAVKRPPRRAARSAACLDDPAVVEHDRAVGDADRREPLRRDEHGAAGDGGTEVLDQQPLGLGVDGRHRIVEDEHARAGEQRPRERDALALAAGEVDAALADQRVVPVRAARRRRWRLRPPRTPRARHPSRRRAAPRAGSRAAGRRRGRASASRSRPRVRSSTTGTSRVSTPPTRTRPPVGS